MKYVDGYAVYSNDEEYYFYCLKLSLYKELYKLGCLLFK